VARAAAARRAPEVARSGDTERVAHPYEKCYSSACGFRKGVLRNPQLHVAFEFTTGAVHMPGLADKFAVNLKSERIRRKLSQEALAAKAGLSVSYISMLERGQRTPPLDTLESLAKALAVSPTSLLS
jgi:ribosome-binding protein aMBF1 (putative translation factor)